MKKNLALTIILFSISPHLQTMDLEGISGFDVSSYNNYLATFSQDTGNIDIWNINNLDEALPSLQHKDVTDVFFVKDFLVSWSSKQGNIQIWQVANLSKQPKIVQHKNLTEVTADDTDNFLISYSDDGSIKVWNLKNLSQPPQELRHTNLSYVFAEKNYLISAAATDGSIKIWNLKNLKAKPQTINHPNVANGLMSYDGKYLVTQSFEPAPTINIWDLKNLQEEALSFEFEAGAIVNIALSENKPLLFLLFNGTVEVWNPNNLDKPAASLQHPGAQLISTFGNYLVSWGVDTIKVWDITNLSNIKELGTLQTTESTMPNVLANKTYLFSQGKDYIMVWELNNLAEFPLALNHPNVEEIRTTSDENILISFSPTDETLKVWNLGPEEEVVTDLATLQENLNLLSVELASLAQAI